MTGDQWTGQTVGHDRVFGCERVMSVVESQQRSHVSVFDRLFMWHEGMRSLEEVGKRVMHQVDERGSVEVGVSNSLGGEEGLS